MRSVFVWIAFLAVVSPAFGASAKGEQLSSGPVPGWVERGSVAIPETVPESQVEDGVYYLDYEQQIRVSSQEIYQRYAVLVLSDTGVQSASDIRVTFDPSDQSLQMHEIAIRREGRVIDRLHLSEIRMLNREPDLDAHLIDGSLTAYCALKDVRIGDVVEYSYTIRGFHPLFGGRLFMKCAVGWSIPLDRQLIRIVADETRAFETRSIGSEATLERRVLGNGEVDLRWEARDLPAIEAEPDTPGWHAVYPSLQVSEMRDWSEVAAWAVPLYSTAGLESSDLDEAASKVRAAASDEEKVLHALRFVQSEVRYLGIEMGHGSYQPNPPDVVLARRFGDCKDKTLLLVELLGKAGIDAVPALTNTESGKAISQWAPSPLAFNHVIAAVRMKGKLHWIDPTRSTQAGPLSSLPIGAYGCALLVESATTALTPLEPPVSARGEVITREVFTVPGLEEPASLEVHSIYSGVSAEQLRNSFKAESLEKIGKSYRDFHARSYPDIEIVAPVRFEDFPETNRVEVRESYRIAKLWEKSPSDGIFRVRFLPQALQSQLSLPSSVRRQGPFGLGQPRRTVEDIEVRLWKPWSIKPQHETVETSQFRYAESLSLEGSVVRMHHELASFADHVPPRDIAEYRDTLAKIQDSIGWTFSSNESGAGDADATQPFEPN